MGLAVPRVFHLTTVHNPFDNRVFHRGLGTFAGQTRAQKQAQL